MQTSFGTFKYSLLAAFRGLSGDAEDLAGMIDMRPVPGSVLYIVYITMVFFIGNSRCCLKHVTRSIAHDLVTIGQLLVFLLGFTILVGIITRSYEQVKNDNVRPSGLLTELYDLFRLKIKSSESDEAAPAGE